MPPSTAVQDRVPAEKRCEEKKEEGLVSFKLVHARRHAFRKKPRDVYWKANNTLNEHHEYHVFQAKSGRSHPKMVKAKHVSSQTIGIQRKSQRQHISVSCGQDQNQPTVFQNPGFCRLRDLRKIFRQNFVRPGIKFFDPSVELRTEKIKHKWRCDVSHNGSDLGDGGPPLLDFRFADDILLFAGSAEQLGYMLDKLVTSLEKVGLKLNAAKTKALTIQAQPPKTLTTRAGLEIAVLDQSSSHKWLGCMLSTENAGRREDDIDHRLQSAARAFHVHKWILCDKMVSMASRLKCVDAMITSVVCFAAGHRKIYRTDLRKFDVHCWKLPSTCCGSAS